MSNVQAILIRRDIFTQRQANAIIRNMRVTPMKLHITDTYYRYRLIDPGYFDHFRIEKGPDGVDFIRGYY